MTDDHSPRNALLDLFQQALEAVRADKLAEQALRGKHITHVIALGKAAETLATGAWQASFLSPSPSSFPTPSAPSFPPPSPLSFPRRRESSLIESGLLIYPQGYATHKIPIEAPFERHEGAHPIPNQSSLDAGAALLGFIDDLPSTSRLAVLLSGGTSASVEVPAPGITLGVLQRTNQWLLASGLPIEDMNRVRAGLSSIKGGRLAQRLSNVSTDVWVLSDIPGNNLTAVGGGLFTTLKDAPLPAIPGWLAQSLQTVPINSDFDLPLQRLGGNDEAVAAVVEKGAKIWGDLKGEAAALGTEIGQKLVDAKPGLYVLGGEPTVHLPEHPGRGGRCQQLALAAAIEIAGHNDCCLLAASTDGWDGTNPVAGACVDGSTVKRGASKGLDARSTLAQADAGSFLEASSNLIQIGPTGTHVNELVIACKRKSSNAGLQTSI